MFMLSKMSILCSGNRESQVRYQGAAAAKATSVTLPAHVAGDFILIFAQSIGGTLPSLPGGYTSAASWTGASTVIRVGYKFASSGSETSGTWTNASSVHATVYKGVKTASPIGNISNYDPGSAQNSITYPSLTCQETDRTSYIVVIGARADPDADVGNVPDSSVILRSLATFNSPDISTAIFDTNGGALSFPGGSSGVIGSNDYNHAGCIELKSA